MIKSSVRLIPEVIFCFLFQILLLSKCYEFLSETKTTSNIPQFPKAQFSSAKKFPPIYKKNQTTPLISNTPLISLGLDATPQQQYVCQKISFPVAVMSMLAQSRRDTSRCVQPNLVVQETMNLPQVNYASKDCLAKVVLANDEAVNIAAVLDDRDNDRYLRNPCEKAQDKFLVIRLCDKIRPTFLELANFELFSSAPKEIRVSVSKTFPAVEWIFIKEFEIANKRDVQRFPISSDLDGAIKFLKIEFLSHYGREYYCTMSFIRVYGIPEPISYHESNSSNGNSQSPTSLDSKIGIAQRQNNTQSSNTAAIFMEFGKRLSQLESNFKHYNQVVQSIKHLRNETRFLKQETSLLHRYIFRLKRDYDSMKKITNRVQIENRRLRQEVKSLKDFRNKSELLQNKKTEL